MVECFKQIADDSNCRAVVLTGAGKIFTAGKSLSFSGYNFSRVKYKVGCDQFTVMTFDIVGYCLSVQTCHPPHFLFWANEIRQIGIYLLSGPKMIVLFLFVVVKQRSYYLICTQTS